MTTACAPLTFTHWSFKPEQYNFGNSSAVGPNYYVPPSPRCHSFCLSPKAVFLPGEFQEGSSHLDHRLVNNRFSAVWEKGGGGEMKIFLSRPCQSFQQVSNLWFWYPTFVTMYVCGNKRIIEVIKNSTRHILKMSWAFLFVVVVGKLAVQMM